MRLRLEKVGSEGFPAEVCFLATIGWVLGRLKEFVQDTRTIHRNTDSQHGIHRNTDSPSVIDHADSPRSDTKSPSHRDTDPPRSDSPWNDSLRRIHNNTDSPRGIHHTAFTAERFIAIPIHRNNDSTHRDPPRSHSPRRIHHNTP